MLPVAITTENACMLPGEGLASTNRQPTASLSGASVQVRASADSDDSAVELRTSSSPKVSIPFAVIYTSNTCSRVTNHFKICLSTQPWLAWPPEQRNLSRPATRHSVLVEVGGGGGGGGGPATGGCLCIEMCLTLGKH